MWERDFQFVVRLELQACPAVCMLLPLDRMIKAVSTWRFLIVLLVLQRSERPWCSPVQVRIAKSAGRAKLSIMQQLRRLLCLQAVAAQEVRSKCPGRCAEFGTCNEELGR